MFELDFDIVVVTDPRFQGGTSSAVAAEISAVAQAGYRVGFISYEAINLRQPLPFHPQLQMLIDRKQLTQVTPGTHIRCRLAILHNPYVAGLIPVEPLNITADARLVVVHHPPLDGHGMPAYDLDQITRNAEEILSGPTDWVPVGPNVRKAFGDCTDGPALLPADWSNVIDFNAWHQVPSGTTQALPTIGRHSRADPRKFPASRDAFLEIYGDGTRAHVDILGCAPQTLTLLNPACQNWTLRPFATLPVRDYLKGLDAFVYYHRDDWIEAFGYTILEAMACGLPCVLSPDLAPSFEGAARIVPPEEAFEAALDVIAKPQDMRDAGYELVHDNHSFDMAVRRVKNLIGPPKKDKVKSPAIIQSEPTALLISTNGIGMGHLTRTLAIARRVQKPVKPVIVTMSHGASVAADFGFHVEFIPYHNYLGVDAATWNIAFHQEVLALIDAHDARVVLFDGNSPFQGMLDAIADRPQVWSIWCRRGMWRPNAHPDFIKRETFFDTVLEPQDLAEAFDAGPTTVNTNLTRKVGPIQLLDPQDQVARSHARQELGLDPDATVILVQLGGGNNFDMRLSRDLVLRHLARKPNVQVVLVNWKISATPLPVDLPANVVSVSTYPIAQYLHAFDATVSAVGYNSFHEAMAAGLPAIYVPNENPSQDDQLARASYAARHGAALVARRHQPERLIQALEAILEPARRASMKRAALALSRDNGAGEAARIISDHAMCYRGHR